MAQRKSDTTTSALMALLAALPAEQVADALAQAGIAPVVVKGGAPTWNIKQEDKGGVGSDGNRYERIKLSCRFGTGEGTPFVTGYGADRNAIAESLRSLADHLAS